MTNALAIFSAFHTAIPEIGEIESSRYQAFAETLESQLKRLDPSATNELLEERLNNLHPDHELLSLYDAIKEFQFRAIGEPFKFDEQHEFVTAISQIATRLNGGTEPDISFVPTLIAVLEDSLLDRLKMMMLNSLIQKNAPALNEYRYKKLEEGLRSGGLKTDPTEEQKSVGHFTHTQQAIAIHYLFHEALGITGVDNTRLMEFAHLLSAKKIPVNQETGKENIRNSGIKSAFNKAWKKEDVNHLNDLRFVLRFFKALDVVGAIGIQNAVAAIEKRIARISEKLNREKD